MTSRMTPLRLVAAALACLTGLLAAAALALADGEDDPSFGTGGTAFSLFFEHEAISYPTGAPYADQAPDGTVVQGSLLTSFAADRGKGQEDRYTLAVTRSTSAGTLIPTFGTSGTGAAFHDLEAEHARLLDVRVLDDNTIVAAVAIVPDDGQGTGPDTAPVPARRGVPLDGPVLLLVTFPADGSSSSAETFVGPSMCVEARAAEIDAAGEAVILWHECDGSDIVGRTLDGKTTTLPGFTIGWDLTLGPDDAPYVLGVEQLLGKRGADSDVDSEVIKLTTGLDVDPAYQGPDHPFDGAPVDISVDGSGRAAVWYQPIRFTEDRLAIGGRWTIGRLNADGTTDTAWGTDGEAAFEGEQFSWPMVPDPWDACLDDPTDRCRVWQLKSMAEGRVLVSGPAAHTMPVRGPGFSGNEWTLARLDANGDPDVTWDDNGVGDPAAGDGIKTVYFEGNAATEPVFLNVGTPDLQTDRKVLLPFTAYDDEIGDIERVADFDSRLVLGVERLNAATPPPPPPPVTQTQPSQNPPAATTPKPVAIASKTCKSRREFKIRLRTGRKKSEQSAIVKADVRVNGKKVSVSKEARRRSVVNLKELPKGRFKVTIKLTLADGGVVRETRRYRTCTKKIEHELGPLRTSPPKKKGGK